MQSEKLKGFFVSALVEFEILNVMLSERNSTDFHWYFSGFYVLLKGALYTLTWELRTGDCKTTLESKKNRKIDILYISLESL